MLWATKNRFDVKACKGLDFTKLTHPRTANQLPESVFWPVSLSVIQFDRITVCRRQWLISHLLQTESRSTHWKHGEITRLFVVLPRSDYIRDAVVDESVRSSPLCQIAHNGIGACVAIHCGLFIPESASQCKTVSHRPSVHEKEPNFFVSFRWTRFT